MSVRGVVVAMVLAILAGLALIFVAWPGTTYGTVTPWDIVGSLVMTALAGDAWALVVVGLASLVACAILAATVWLSRQTTNARPG
jgi:branched-subunit amino acid transport protein AzlD